MLHYRNAVGAGTTFLRFLGSSFTRFIATSAFLQGEHENLKVAHFPRSAIVRFPPELHETPSSSLVGAPLRVRTIRDSICEVTLPFSTDSQLRGIYMNIFGNLRWGRILEDLDVMAGSVAYAHSEGFQRDLTIVTASVDQIDIRHRVPSTKDLHMKGWVQYVGRSSMEVKISVSHLDDTDNAPRRDVADASFVMVARDKNKAAQVNKLQAISAEEMQWMKAGEKNQRIRVLNAENSLDRRHPTAEETAIMHDLFLGQNEFKGTTIPMAGTRQETTLLMQPQKRNLHDKIFGGYLMRMATELAHITSHLFAKMPCLFRALDDIHFLKPVNVGDFLSFTSRVAYSTDTWTLVDVKAEVIDPTTLQRSTTNVFNYSFSHAPISCRVIPNTYEEAITWLAGRRRYQALLSRMDP